MAVAMDIYYRAIPNSLDSRTVMEKCDDETNPERLNSLQKTSIHSLPNELFEIIIGLIAFVDLPHFLQSSKTFNVSSIISFEFLQIFLYALRCTIF
jgi:hypothetical protein